ncbi:HAMP domain-containing sensor histidine kinase [Jeotgalibacillus campisalis]|uniref:Signal transduction histidine-protein kinase ArlS n=1 Tax=Jeotgalibacillus campisalis TaxID=220754 RepID=A0A0C2RCA9_9BACL|nr:HAMP domain-containing histidine kinase [Jeotgalibacillus campisalis]KIL47925.1 histidine kinase [Jeotgalibacillus campisalis]
MNKLKKFWNRLSLRWKWTIAGATAIFISFSLFSIILITAMSQWMLQEEQNAVNSVLDDLSQFYESRGPRVTTDDVYESRDLLEQVYEKGQTIRLYNQDGFELFEIQSEEPIASVAFEPVQTRRIDKGGSGQQDVLIGRSPIRSQQFNGYVEVIHPLSQLQSMQAYMILLSLILGLGSLFVSGIVAYLLSGRLIAPVVSLGHAMKKTQNEGFQKQLALPDVQDEIGGLVEIFNDMMDELESTFTKQRQFVEDASHELRTPIQIIEGHLSLINRWGKHDPEIMEESLGISMQELDRIKRLVNELLMLSKADREVGFTHDSQVFPNEVIRTVLTRIKGIYPSRTFHTALAESKEAGKIDALHLEQILIILIENAIKYSPEDEQVVIKSSVTKDFYIISVEDYGQGIAPEHIPKIFDRFYRIDKARSRHAGGNGLGLSIAKKLIDLYQGDITVKSRENKGTIMTISIPLAD